MPQRSAADDNTREPGNRFATTMWSRVLAAASANDPAARPALADLCRAYWYPLYGYLRRQGLPHAEAEDTVQAFFARLLEGNVLRHADPARGRFRGFLLTALRQFRAGRHAYESAAKRRPPDPVVSIETEDGEARYARELTDHATPDRFYDYAWAMSVLNRSMERLRDEYRTHGAAERFEAFHGVLTGQTTREARELAKELGMTEGSVRVAVHRLKKRYGELLRSEVASTLDGESEVEEELRDLLGALQVDRTT